MATAHTVASLDAELVRQARASQREAASARQRAQAACVRARLAVARSDEIALAAHGGLPGPDVGVAASTSGCAGCEQLRRALETRDLIWTAKVVIAAATGQGPAEVHQLLVQQSQAQNIKVRDVAAEIVRGAEHRHAADDPRPDTDRSP